VFSNLNWWEIVGLALLGLFIFGPERLPKVISDGVRMLRQVREMARNATTDLSRELGTEVRLEDLHPKTLTPKPLLPGGVKPANRRPFDDAYRDVQQITSDVNDVGSRRPKQELPPAPRGSAGEMRAGEAPDGEAHNYDQVRPFDRQPRPYQPDAPGPDTGRYDNPRGYDADAT